MRKVVLFILCLVCFSLVKVEAQIVNSSDTTIIRPKAPSRPELFCAFDEMSSEIIITPCTYTGLVSVTVTNIDTGAIALFTMASLSCGEERISFICITTSVLTGSRKPHYENNKFTCLCFHHTIFNWLHKDGRIWKWHY